MAGVSRYELPSPAVMPNFKDYKERKPSTSELDFFRRSGVPGYAAEDGSVVINPVQQPGVNYESVRINEHVRLLIRGGKVQPPNFQITTAQQQRFKDYGSLDDIRATIAARLVSGDPSAGEATEEQRSYMNSILLELE